MRLRIACVGSGCQRYTFKEERRYGNPLNSRQQSRDRSSLVLSQQAAAPQQLLRNPSNEESRLVSALLGKLNASDDLRYHLCWTYGDFLNDVPKRIGTNEALDSAVAAVVSAHSSLGSHKSTSNVSASDSLWRYSSALRSLRLYLDDPAKARETETLCAVMLLLICQAFLGVFAGNWTGHGEGAAQILKARAFFRTQDEFERKLILTLRGPVSFEALINPKICFTTDEWAILAGRDFSDESDESQMMHCLAHAPDLIQKGRMALQEHVDVTGLITKTRHYYSILQGVSRSLEDSVKAIQKRPYDGTSRRATLLARAHAYYQRSYGLAISICIVFNCILRALETDDTELDVEAKSLCDSTLVLADEAAIYRPLGASYVGLCLVAAWCSTKDEKTKAKIEEVLLDYRSDFPGEYAETLKSELEFASQRLSLAKL